MGAPSNVWGRVKWGYSSNPAEKLSSVGRSPRAQHPRDQPDRRFDQRHGGDFAARQHKIADADFLDAARRRSPVGPALQSGRTAGPRRARPPGRAPAPGSAARRAATDRSTGRRAPVHRVDRRRRHIGPHHHAGTAACRGVIDAAMLAQAMVANIAHVQRPQILFASALPSSDTPSGPGNMSGKSVRQSRSSLSSVQRHPRAKLRWRYGPLGDEGMIIQHDHSPHRPPAPRPRCGPMRSRWWEHCRR